jgi:CRP-like cAMP-binding protein
LDGGGGALPAANGERMPKALTYRMNSVIYFQGDPADKIYILQKGKVSLNYSDIENGQDVHELIQMGEFFGVKSALGKYPREENALVLQDAMVLMFTVPEFEQFASQNIRIITKMLKVFSNQLRRIHGQVENLLEKDEQASPETGLFKTGEYYLKNRMYSQASYVFSRYLTYYPAGKMARDATKNLEVAESSLKRYGQGKGPQPMFQGEAAGAGQDRGGNQDRGGGLDDELEVEEMEPSSPAPRKAAQTAQKQEMSDSAKKYYNAVSIFTQEKYKEAYQEFKKIAESGQDEEYVAKAAYEIGRCLFFMGQIDACLAQFTKMLQAYPRHPDIADTLFYMGQAYEKKGDKARSAGFYKKILSMDLDEDESARIKARRALKAIEG